MTDQSILLDRRDNILHLTLNRPDKLNSLTASMLSELGDVLSDIGTDDEARVLVITGAGRGFCAGQDLREAGAIGDGRSVRNVIERHYNPIIRQIRGLAMPVVAAVNGIAAGAGANLALACDIVVAAESASFVQAFSRIGLIPDAGGTYFFPRVAGFRKAFWIMATNPSLTAEEAAEIDLVTQVVDDESFRDEVEKVVRRFADSAPGGLSGLKALFRASLNNTLDDQLNLEARSVAARCADPRTMERLEGFLAKKK